MKKSRKIVVTGASKGLGKAVAKKFWETGASLALVARNRVELENLAKELDKDRRGRQIVETFACDLSNIAEIPALVEAIKSRFGDPDVLVNNAGSQGPIGPLQENDWVEWQKCLNVCLLAPVLLCRGFLPAMIKRRYGRIINVSGGGAANARPNFSSYATAKCGLVRFTETLAEEVKGFGITANCIAPGAMKGEMAREVVKAGAGKAGNKEYIKALELMKEDGSTLGRASDLVLFLASGCSKGITGKLVSAVWDPWGTLPMHSKELKGSDVYTLRRIVPKDRGMGWGEA